MFQCHSPKSSRPLPLPQKLSLNCIYIVFKEAFFKLYLVINSVLCFQVGDAGRESSPTGDPRSSHLESEAGLCVNLVPSTGPGAGWWVDTGALQKRQWDLYFHMGSGNRGTRPPPAPPRGLDEKEPPPQEPKMSGRGEHARDQSGRQASY